MPTDIECPQSSSVGITGSAGLDLGGGSGNAKASCLPAPVRMSVCVTTLFPTLSHDEETLSQSS